MHFLPVTEQIVLVSTAACRHPDPRLQGQCLESDRGMFTAVLHLVTNAVPMN